MKKGERYYHKSKKLYNRDFTGFCKIITDNENTCLVQFEDYHIVPTNKEYQMRVYKEDLR